MARDRQRAKQRRRRHSGGAGPAGPARTRPRENDPVAPDDAETQDTDFTTEARDPVFPTRGSVQPVEADDEVAFDEQVEPAPDELDPAVTEEREERIAVARGGRRKRGRIITFLGHVVDELRRVQWPDRQHVAQGTAVTLGFVVVAGAYLGLMDAIWKPLIQAIL
jgi:preprotein translocase SecE subunit